MKNKSVIQIDLKSQDYDQMAKQVQTLAKAPNKIMMKFPLQQVKKNCIEEDTKNRINCSYLIQADGLQVFQEKLIKFSDSAQIVLDMLAIIYSCLQSIDDDETALSVSICKIPTKCLELMKGEDKDVKAECLKILNKISNFHSSHDELIKQNVLQFLEEEMDKLTQLDVAKIQSKEVLMEMARIFDLVRNFGENTKKAEILASTQVLPKLIGFYQKNESVNLFKGFLIKSLLPMTKSPSLVAQITGAQINFKTLAISSLSDRNLRLITQTKQLLQNLVRKQEIEQLVQNVSSGTNEEEIIFLSFISGNKELEKLLEDQKLVTSLCNKLGEVNGSENLKVSCINLLKDILQNNDKFVDVFLNSDGLEQSLKCIEDQKEENYFFFISTMQFLEVIMDKNKGFAKKLQDKNLSNRLMNKYILLNKDFKEFFSKAITMRKALNSIEWNKGEASQAILKTRFTIDEKTIVNQKLALNYIACESLSVSLIRVFAALNRAESFDNKILDKEFFSTTMELLKTFKNQKGVYENVFEFLGHVKLDLDQVKIIQQINYNNFLCEKVWNQNGWKKFFLHTLRYMENIMKDPKHIAVLKESQSAILLLASLKNYINEEDYNDFEEANENDEQEAKDVLTYAEEREVHRKSPELIQQLIETVALDNFRENIKRELKNFKPIAQTIQILRANYAVLTVVNGINTFGCIALKQNDQNWLMENIEQIEKQCKYQDFKNKEKLLGDCIKCIANFVGITHNVKGKDLYVEKEISAKVFGLFDKYLSQSKSPLRSFVFLKVFKEWLIERIEIIQNATNQERWDIYRREDFMMVANDKKDDIIMMVMDTLYGTHAKFEDKEKVVALNMEVIILLGYVYPEWYSKTGRNFVPQALDVVCNENFDKDTQQKALDVIVGATKCDEKSDTPDEEQIHQAVEKGAIDKITECIVRNDFDKDMIKGCEKLFDTIGKTEQHLDDSYNLIDQLIKEIRTFNASKDKENPLEMMKVKRAVEKLNALCLIDPLRVYAFEKEHSKVVNDLFSYINDKKGEKDVNSFQENYLTNLEKGCCKTMVMHQKSIKNDNDFAKLYGPNSKDPSNSQQLANNALRSLKLNPHNPELVSLNSKILNWMFPTDYSGNVKAIAKDTKFQPIMDDLLKEHGDSADQDLNREVKELFMNLSESKDDDMMERMLRKLLSELKQAIAKGDVPEIGKLLNQILPFVDHPIFEKLYQELDVDDYILRILKLLHKNTKDKTKQGPLEILSAALGTDQVPDLGSENRKILEDDRALAKHITTFCLKLPEKLKERVRKREPIVELSNIAGLLNGSTETFALYNDFLKIDKNAKILLKNKTFDLGVYLIAKNNGDNFETRDPNDEASIKFSTLSPGIQPTNTRTSQLSQIQADQADMLQKTMDDFSNIALKVLDTKQITDLFQLYINANNNYQKDKPKTLENLLNISRQIGALLKVSDDSLNLKPYCPKLKQSFAKFLKELNKEEKGNEKLLKLFTSNFNDLAKRLQGGPNNMESPEIWNDLIKRFLVVQPDALKNRTNQILENIELTRPVAQGIKKKVKFNENKAEFSLELEEESSEVLNPENSEKVDKIQDNLYKTFLQKLANEQTMIGALKSLTQSVKFSKAFLKNEKGFQMFFERLSDSIQLGDELMESHFGAFDNIVKSLDTEEDIKLFQKPSHQKLIEELVEVLESQSMDDEKILITLNQAYDFLNNKNVFKQKNFPITAFKLFKEDMKNEQRGILLSKIISEPLLVSQIENDLCKETIKDLEEKLYNKKYTLKNPGFENFKTLTDLNQESDKKIQEFRAYFFGQLTKNKELSKQLRFKPKGDQFNCLNLYDEFERYGHIPIIATKSLQAVRNAILEMEKEEMMDNPEKIEDLIKRIPVQIEKYKAFGKTPLFLKEILDHLKLFESQSAPKTALERNVEQISQKEDIEKLKDLNDIGKMYKDIVQKLGEGPLSQEDSKCLERLNRELASILNMQNAEGNEALLDQEVPQSLREIANNPNSTMIQKQEALELLNKFCGDKLAYEKMLENDFFTSRSQSLIAELLSDKKDTESLEAQKALVLQEDLEFMKNLTNDPKGVQQVMKNKPADLIEDCFRVLLGENPNIQLKIEALEVLRNLLKWGNDRELEKRLADQLDDLLKGNAVHPELVASLVNVASIIDEKSPDYEKKMIEENILEPIKQALKLHRDCDRMNEEIGKFLLQLAKNKPENQDYIMKSEILPELVEPFQSKKSPKIFHQNMAQLLMELGFGNPERKQELCKQGWTKGLVALLIHYSDKQNYDEEMISTVLKLMANFSLIPEGTEHLLGDGVIPAFRDFFDTYKDSLPQQNEYMLQTLVNLCYEPREDFVTKIIKDKGIELILDAMQHYHNLKNAENTEKAIDALTLVCHSPQSLQYLEKKDTKAIDILVDILRQKMNSNLVYKSLRCLTQLAQSKKLEEKILKKDAQRAAADIFKEYRDDHKNIFQAVKFIAMLVKNNPDKLEDFIFAGVPEKIIANFDQEWPIDIIKEILSLFSQMIVNEEVKNKISESFLDSLIPVMDKHFKNKNIVLNGVHLLALCSDNIVSAEKVQGLDGNKLAEAILKSYLSSEKIIYDDLLLMENTIRMVQESKPEFLSWKTDDLVENIVDTTSPDTQKKLHQQAVIVLELLRDKRNHNIQDAPIENRDEQNPEEIKESDDNTEESSEEIPPNVKKFLTQGKILRVYGDDKVCRSMHVYLSNDMNDLRCKHPKESHVKQKWLMHIHQIKDVSLGYKKDSPIGQSGSLFKKAPKFEQCFVVYGPPEMGGVKNFYIKCDNERDATTWVSYLNKVLEEYKKTKAKNLKRDEQVN